jgi:prepilin-type N-terminal cleavage/methylation domain-containing protein
MTLVLPSLLLDTRGESAQMKHKMIHHDVQARRNALAPRARNAFTLVEVILVVLILSLFAGLIIPRIAGITSSKERLVVTSAADLLSAFAYRDSIASGTAAIEYDGTNRNLFLLGARGGDSAEEPLTWQRDPLAPVVRFPDSIDIRALADGELLPETNWSITAREDGTRPEVQFEINGKKIEARVSLPTWAQGPYVVESRAFIVPKIPDSIDLDAIGQGRDTW